MIMMVWNQGDQVFGLEKKKKKKTKSSWQKYNWLEVFFCLHSRYHRECE
jgi:hypothetical protein